MNPDEAPPSPLPPLLALIEVLDREGLPHQSFAVRRWPVTLGRGLDCDLVLGDPHVAAGHLRIDAPAADGDPPVATVGETRNGVLFGRRRLARGARVALPGGAEPSEFTLGRTRVRLRWPGQPLPAELLLTAGQGADTGAGGAARRLGLPLAAGIVVVVGGLLFSTWLGTDPEAYPRVAGTTLLGALAGAGIWCGGWALLTQAFAHRARFGWHLRVFLGAAVAWLALSVVPGLVAFAFSWPWASDFDFVGTIAIATAALYFHLLAIEPARRRGLRIAAAACGLTGIAISMWFNQQRTDQFGDELYMSHLFPPALRLARPVPVDRLVDRLAGLKPRLDRKAAESGAGDDAGESNEDDDNER